MDAESNYKKAIKQAEADLNTKLEKKYPQLTLEEIRHLLVEEKVVCRYLQRDRRHSRGGVSSPFCSCDPAGRAV